jgi:NodT family efflux transporter outer membrane factor (OMF) lipoprotein
MAWLVSKNADPRPTGYAELGVIALYGLGEKGDRATPSRLVSFVFIAAALLASAGCICGPDFQPPATPVPDTWHQSLQDGTYVSKDQLGAWWELFNDPQMTELIHRAGQRNLTLYQAATRIYQARTQVCIANSARLPQVGAGNSFSNQKQSANAFGFGGVAGFFVMPRDLWSHGFDVAWEPDLFGRVARSIESAEATTCARVEAYRDILVTLYGDVAREYVQVRTLQAQLDYGRRNVEIQKQALDLVKKRVDGGVSPILDQYQAESNLSSTEAQLPPLEAQLQQALNRIAVLLGEYPGALHGMLCPPAPIPSPIGPLPLVVPCDMVRQRPDIREAERLVAARSADIGVAIAEIYPRFSIGGSVALQAQKFEDIFDGQSETYSLGPSASWPIFRGFQIKCNIERTDQAFQEAVSIYESTILLAFEEVENATQAYNKELKRREALRRTVEAAKKSLESVLELYRGGKTNFQNVLDTQRTLFLAENSLAISEGLIVTNLIALYKALGGGWDPHHHCHQQEVRLQCPDRADPALCDTPAPSNTTPETLPTPKAVDDRKDPKDALQEAEDSQSGNLKSDDSTSHDSQSGDPKRNIFDAASSPSDEPGKLPAVPGADATLQESGVEILKRVRRKFIADPEIPAAEPTKKEDVAPIGTSDELPPAEIGMHPALMPVAKSKIKRASAEVPVVSPDSNGGTNQKPFDMRRFYERLGGIK